MSSAPQSSFKVRHCNDIAGLVPASPLLSEHADVSNRSLHLKIESHRFPKAVRNVWTGGSVGGTAWVWTHALPVHDALDMIKSIEIRVNAPAPAPECRAECECECECESESEQEGGTSTRMAMPLPVPLPLRVALVIGGHECKVFFARSVHDPNLFRLDTDVPVIALQWHCVAVNVYFDRPQAQSQEQMQEQPLYVDATVTGQYFAHAGYRQRVHTLLTTAVVPIETDCMLCQHGFGTLNP